MDEGLLSSGPSCDVRKRDLERVVRSGKRKIPKPMMEKRRRDRINHSLETLRLLLLENTCNEKLKNPKVEKAEILESVVEFLKTEKEKENEKEHQSKKGVQSRDCQGGEQQQQQTYREGMRTCLMRVNHFIATKTQELEETRGVGSSSHQTSLGFPGAQTHNNMAPDQVHKALGTTTSTCDQTAPSPRMSQHQHLPRQVSQSHPSPGLMGSPSRRTGLDCDHNTRKLLSPKSNAEVTDPVWRPWPQ
ncbi:hairy-related 5 [Lampris incognitus]|uniref:hairy-related 5 n=1 Tax=Lampris incognitus TaxID=2546036 RepID=UPI0024B5E8FA|nr:hairy-related 5 [Lampris incognitus]